MKYFSLIIIGLGLFLFKEGSASHYNIRDIDLIPNEYRNRLIRFGIYNTEILLYIGKSKFARWRLANIIKVRSDEVFKWVQFSDLLRIRGIGPNVAKLFIASNISDIKTLKRQDANRLRDLLVLTNNQKGVTKVIPETHNLIEWINQAKNMRNVIQY